jgi:TM2 domain-containing membrane protein YozV
MYYFNEGFGWELFGYFRRKEREMDEDYVLNGVAVNAVSNKSKVVALLLCLFLGSMGLHRIYLGHIVTGVMLIILNVIGVILSAIYIGYIFTVIAGIIEVVDFFRIIFGGLKDKEGRPLK